MTDETRYLIALSKIPHIGAVTAKTLTAYCGSTEAVFHAKEKTLSAIPGIGHQVIDALRKSDPEALVDQELVKMQKENIQVLPYWDEHFPFRLKSLPDGPMLLYYKGDVLFNRRRILGIVGTRNSTPYGRRMVQRIVKGLKDYDVLIVSGLAYGIDAAAHGVALSEQMATVGVVAHGLDMIYPAAHRKMARQMLDSGGLISEFPCGVLPQKERFPMRNRIIAGLSDALLVVETGKSGGSMITVQYATDYDRQVFAVPGRADDQMSQGTNYLISKQVAQLVCTAEDIAETMFWKSSNKAGRQMELFPELDSGEALVLSALERGEETHIDDIIESTGLSVGKLGAILLTLEMKGLIGTCPGTRYVKF